MPSSTSSHPRAAPQRQGRPGLSCGCAPWTLLWQPSGPRPRCDAARAPALGRELVVGRSASPRRPPDMTTLLIFFQEAPPRARPRRRSPRTARRRPFMRASTTRRSSQSRQAPPCTPASPAPQQSSHLLTRTHPPPAISLYQVDSPESFLLRKENTSLAALISQVSHQGPTPPRPPLTPTPYYAYDGANPVRAL